MNIVVNKKNIWIILGARIKFLVRWNLELSNSYALHCMPLMLLHKLFISCCRISSPKNRWEDDVISDITNMKITDWRDCIKTRPKWKEFVEKAKTSLKL